MKPTVGDQVHYTSRDTEKVCAATIVDVEVWPKSLLAIQPCDADDQTEGYYAVSLFILFGSGSTFKHNVPFSATPRAGHWKWPS